jgi:Na+-transporting methylmalonyl-CoA/oxaloacetate decarboxylase beta subunit
MSVLFLQWAAVLMFVVGCLLLYLRIRRWYDARTWDDIVLTVREDE